jgi:N-acyl-D-aspartate/D-glutamate deacylase
LTFSVSRIDVIRRRFRRLLNGACSEGCRRLLGRSFSLVAAGLLCTLSVAPLAAGYDLILQGGRLIDGTGSPGFTADLAVRGDRIAAIGDLSAASAGEIIDVSGLIIAPGFIDTHSHAGPGLATPELSHGEPLLAQGITTVFINPDGGGEVDIAAQRTALLQHGLGVNVAQFVPHGAVRNAVLGMDDRAPTPEELFAMRQLVRDGMAAGAWGLSSGPFYAPGSFAVTDEFVALAREAAAYDGAYQSHVRDESDYSIGLLAALDEVVAVAREAGLPGVHTHIKALGPPVWGFSDAIIRRIESARAVGVEVYADQYPYLASATSLGAALLPRWAQAGGREALLARLDDSGEAARILAEVTKNLARRGGAERIQFRRVQNDPDLEGRSLSDVARAWQLSPEAATLRLLRAGEVGIVSFNMKESDVRALMRQPWTMTASDGGLVPMGEGVPHPRSYGSFPHKLRRYVFEEAVLSLEMAVRSMTGLPAQVYGMPDRGRLAPGLIADIVVFDPDALRDRATFTKPHQLSEGVVHLLVAGEAAIRDSRFTGVGAGRVLRKSGAGASD